MRRARRESPQWLLHAPRFAGEDKIPERSPHGTERNAGLMSKPRRLLIRKDVMVLLDNSIYAWFKQSRQNRTYVVHYSPGSGCGSLEGH